MDNNWFQRITNYDISCDENIPNWLKDGVNDSKYIIIEKANYEIKCNLLDKQIQENKQKLKELEILSLTNSISFKDEIQNKEKIIRGLEYKISRITKKQEHAHELLKELQEKYDELKHKCDDIQSIVSNLDNTIVDFSS